MRVLNGLHGALFGRNSAMETWDHEQVSQSITHVPFHLPASSCPLSLPHLHLHLYSTLHLPQQENGSAQSSRREEHIGFSLSWGKKKFCFLPCWWHEWLKMNIQGHIRNQSTVVKERKKAWADFMRVFHSSQQQLKFKPGTRRLHLHMSGSSKG